MEPMQNKPIKEMTQAELWKEILAIIDACRLTETDRGLFIQLLSEFNSR